MSLLTILDDLSIKLHEMVVSPNGICHLLLVTQNSRPNMKISLNFTTKVRI